MKELLFSITKDDFDWQYFRTGGPGGQAQNKTSSGVRCLHSPSGAVGRAIEEREQSKNKKMAFKRCVESKLFQTWLKKKTAEMCMEETIESKLEKAMQEKNIKTEIKEKGKWIQVGQDWFQEK